MTRKAQDIWEFKDPTNPIYPTEKNLDMLKFIIEASSNSDSIVMDCFCGSGSTLQAAEICGRKWIGVDQSEVSIQTVHRRLKQDDLFSNVESHFEFIDLSAYCDKMRKSVEPIQNLML